MSSSDFPDPILNLSFAALADWFINGREKAREWNYTLEPVLRELFNLNHWWTRLRPLREPARDLNERAAYHRVDTEQLIRLLKLREFLTNTQQQVPFFPAQPLPEEALFLYSTDELASALVRRGDIGAVAVVAHDEKSGIDPQCGSYHFWSQGTPKDRVWAAKWLLDGVCQDAIEDGLSENEIERIIEGEPPEFEDD